MLLSSNNGEGTGVGLEVFWAEFVVGSIVEDLGSDTMKIITRK
jgi:hypothetical protein